MLTDAWDALGCPYCCGALAPAEDDGGALRCLACGEQFATEGTIPILQRPEEGSELARFAQQYQEARHREGWQRLTPDEARSLPYGQPPGYPRLYWEVRQQSFCTLMQLLARQGPSPADGPAADLGAGFGWLSYRLAELGYRVAALETSRDESFGLGAAVQFVLIQGDLNHLPFQPGRWALVIFNASLHYAADLERTLWRGAQALQKDGWLIVLDTPISRRPHPGTGRGDRHLSRPELDAALAKAGLRPRWIKVRRGPRWRSHQLRAWLRRDPVFSFPIIASDRI
jgi:SAM-dependent methyltransferase